MLVFCIPVQINFITKWHWKRQQQYGKSHEVDIWCIPVRMCTCINNVCVQALNEITGLCQPVLLKSHVIPTSTVTSCVGGCHNMPPPPVILIFLLTLKVVSESRVTWATSVPILVFLGLSVLDLGPMYATDRRQRERDRQKDVRLHHRLMPPPPSGDIINRLTI